MWFKNCRTFQLRGDFPGVTDELLETRPFVECGSLDPKRQGFVPVIEGQAALTHTVNGATIFCLKTQEKILPANAIADKLNAKVKSLEEAEARKVHRKERAELKDEIIFSLLPKALTKSSLTYGYFDAVTRMFHIDSSSPSRAEDIMSLIREISGSLPTTLLYTEKAPASFLTDTLRETPEGSDDLRFTANVTLAHLKDGSKVRFSDWDLAAEEVAERLRDNMAVQKISAEWKDRVAFDIDGDFVLKKIKFQDVVMSEASDRNPESRAEQFDADFAIMSQELRDVILGLIFLMGGIRTPAI